MNCRNCGAEIADKALICYKCGTATTDAKYQPAKLGDRAASRSSSRTLIVTVVIIALLVLLALYFGVGMR
jgi:uncharacterized membrane protein YvbJ